MQLLLPSVTNTVWDLDENLPREIKEFIKKLLVVNPDDRLSNVSSDEIFKNITEKPFVPGNLKLASIKPKEEAENFTIDPLVYEVLESSVIRIPPADFFASDYYKAI